MDLIHGPLKVTSMSTVGRGSPVSKAPFLFRGKVGFGFRTASQLALGSGMGWTIHFNVTGKSLGIHPS